MKKILLSTIVLLAFAVSILFFEISCKKQANAQSSTSTVKQQNRILYVNFTATAGEIWSANYDGSNQQKLNIALPATVVVSQDSQIKLSPDGKTIFFTAFSPGPVGLNRGIYSCNIDGSNAHIIVAGGANGNSIGVAY